jgi:hypothetical protein
MRIGIRRLPSQANMTKDEILPKVVRPLIADQTGKMERWQKGA